MEDLSRASDLHRLKGEIISYLGASITTQSGARGFPAVHYCTLCQEQKGILAAGIVLWDNSLLSEFGRPRNRVMRNGCYGLLYVGKEENVRVSFACLC